MACNGVKEKTEGRKNMLTFEFVGNCAGVMSFSGLDILLTFCVAGIAVAVVVKKIAKRFKK